jgi:hypothetical protein
MSLKETGLAGGGLQARSDDQLSGSISSENNTATNDVKFHPLADLFPLMEGEAFDELVADIKANGLNDEIILYEGVVLDGRNRYRAWIAGKKKGAIPAIHIDRAVEEGAVKDPLAWVISGNIHRRHLTAEQKHEVIAKLLKAKPEASNNAIAKQVKVDDKTVATVRRGMEARSEIPNVEHRTDTRGRKQPAKKKVRKSKAAEEANRNRKARERRAEKRKRKNNETPTQIEIEEAEAEAKAKRLVLDLIRADRGLARQLLALLWSGDYLVVLDALRQELGDKETDGNGIDPEQSAVKRREEFAKLDDPTDPGPIPECLRRTP